MTDKNAGPRGRGLSRSLLHAVSAEGADCHSDLPTLAREDVAALKQVLRGERDPGIRIDRKRAVKALANSERSRESSDILAGILSNPKETTQMRALAANKLGLMPPEPAEAALLRSLHAEDEMVRVEVFKSLGRVGTARALERLKELPDPETEHVRRQLSLARVAIAFRSGSEWHEGQGAAGDLGVRWTTHAARALEGGRVREHVAALRDSNYGIALNLETGFEINCGQRVSHLLLLNEAVKRGAYVESVRARKMIAGLVALPEKEERHMSVRYLVLTAPSERGLEVIVTRTNGDVAYVGEAQPDRDGFRLTLRDVGLERMAIEIEGHASDEDLRLNLRVWRGQAKPKKHGEPIRAV